MLKLMRTRRHANRKDPKRTTTVSFSAEDLAALGRLIGAGQVLLQTTHPVVARLKAAMSRLGLPIPRGL